MSNPQSPSKILDNLTELLSQEVEQKSDDELVEDLGKEDIDIESRVREIRTLLREKIAAAHKSRGMGQNHSVPKLESPAGRAYLKHSDSPLSLRTVQGDTSFVRWTNSSVRQFAQGIDPLKQMILTVEGLVKRALEMGWSGPPYDPFQLAELLRIKVVPNSDIAEARTVRGANGGFLIEFNPVLPISRIRFSIAHEITHTFFPDCLERARYRARRITYGDDDWQLEMLCNVGAAEILMPTGSFSSIRNEGFDIVRLMEVRKRLGVSTEAVLLRAVKLAKAPIACFVASVRTGRLRPDYVAFSDAWPVRRLVLPVDSLANRCAAIGFIARGTEAWQISGANLPVDVQAVGLPAYQGQDKLRVAGLVRPKLATITTLPSVEYLVGDALKPTGEGRKIVAHIVNDTTPRWGGNGFAASMKKVWPEVQHDFAQWVHTHKKAFRLGAFHVARHSEQISVFTMVAQHGYGPSERPRIRYGPLERCLEELAAIATHNNCTVHMPKIGTGLAAGNWAVIEELIEHLVCARNIRVFVYQLERS